MSPQETAVHRPSTKKLSTRIVGAGTLAKQKEEQRAKPPSKPIAKKEIPRHARTEAELVKPAQGQSYAQLIKELKTKINSLVLKSKV